MTKPYPALCRDCYYSTPDLHSAWTLCCKHPVVNAGDEWALSSTEIRGTSCTTERGKTNWFAKCGKAGNLWEQK